MTFQILPRFLQATALNIFLSAAVFAQDCPLSTLILVHSCQADVQLRLRVLPDGDQANDHHILTVAGTYSSGDRFGIEGLVIQNGKTVSRRYQNWDGVLIIDQNAKPHLFHANAVILGGDVEIQLTYRAAGGAERQWFDDVATQVSEIIDFRSMAVVNNGEQTERSLTQVKR